MFGIVVKYHCWVLNFGACLADASVGRGNGVNFAFVALGGGFIVCEKKRA